MGKITKKYGIEKISIDPSTLFLDLEKLALYRGSDVKNLHNSLMVKERSVAPVWEDSVTMAVNAVEHLNLSKEEKQDIGLLIVGTETSVDHEKSISSWVHNFVKLPSTCRNFEVKSACYSGTAALQMALAWLSTRSDNKKALIVTADQSLIGLNEPYEYVLGCGATALLVSDNPKFLEIPLNHSGIYASEVTDVIRPLPWVETGNSEHSLFAYMESLQCAYTDFIEVTENKLSFDKMFDFNIYHMPFAGISFMAHKTLLQQDEVRKSSEMKESFNSKTYSSLLYSQRMGGTYGGCMFVSMLSLVSNQIEIKTNQKIGVFSYGSGSCAEYYTAIIGNNAKQIAISARTEELLNHRYELTVEEYELIENQRVDQLKGHNFIPDISILKNFYNSHYKGKKRLILKEIKNYYRYYEWS